MQVVWEAWSPTRRVGEGEVHVLVWPLRTTGDKPGSGSISSAWREQLLLLDQQERARADRFTFERHRIAFVQAHAGMRQLLASYLEVPVSVVSYKADPLGKPRLASSLAHLNFNLSHTESLCALALSLSGIELGIDVERIRPMEKLVADTHFSVAERAELERLSGSDWTDAFFRCWTRKEAVLKAEGAGLRTPLDSFDVSLLPGEEAALRAWRSEARFTYQWRLHHLQPEANVTGAVATSTDSQITYFRLD